MGKQCPLSEWGRTLCVLEMQAACCSSARPSSPSPGVFPTAPSATHPIPSFKISLVPGQESLRLESCRIPSCQAVSCNHSTSSWDPASCTKPSPAESKVIFLQLPTCSQPLGLSLLLPLFVQNSRELNDILSTKRLQRLARPFLCPSASMMAEAPVYKCALLGSAKREAVSDCLRSWEVTLASIAKDQSSLAW